MCRSALLIALATFLSASVSATADVVTEWNLKAGELAVAAAMPTPPTVRVFAIVQTSVYEAVNAITKVDPIGKLKLNPAPGASVDAAVASASCNALLQLVPRQREAIEKAYTAALSAMADGPAKTAGIALGKQAADEMVAMCANDGAAADPTYRPYAPPGFYVPTTIPVALTWANRRPWIMSKPDQFRPGPPPGLKSELWARDYKEIKALGAKNSTQRTAEQTEIAKFWEASAPTLYMGVVQSVATAPGRNVTQNARLFATVTQAMDDAAIAVFDGKYHYNLWRPITAIRNGDNDGNDATERDSMWVPLIDTPMHPEYPCAHCIVAATVGTVLQAEVGTGPMPVLKTASPTAAGATRSWTNVDDLIREVSEARIYDGVHYRTSTEVGAAMGRKIGALAAAKYLKPVK